MTVVIAIVGVLLLCVVVTGVWVWYARSRPLDDTDVRLEKVDRELRASDHPDEVVSDISVAPTTPIPGIPLQRTGPGQVVRRQLHEPGSAA